MKEKVLAAYVFVKTWRFIAWVMLPLCLMTGGVTLLVEMTTSCRIFIQAWEKYYHDVEEREGLHNRIVLHNVEQGEKAVSRLMDSYQFSLEQIKKVNPSAQLYPACPIKSSDFSELENETAHFLMHAIQISAPAINVSDMENSQGKTIQRLGELIHTNKSQMYSAIFASMKEVQSSLLAEISRVEEEISAKQAQQEDLRQQIESILHPLVRKEVERQIPRSDVYLPEKSVYKDLKNYRALHEYGIELPIAATYPKVSYALEHSKVQAWKESISRLAVWLPMHIHREPLKELVMKEVKDMRHILSKEESDRITTLNGRIEQIEKEIMELNQKLDPFRTQLANMEREEQSLVEHQAEVFDRWQVDEDYQEIRSIAKAADSERFNYINDMAIYVAERKETNEKEISRALKEMKVIGLFVGAAWLGWFLLLVMGDYMVCPLVCTLRSQGLETPFPGKKN